MNEQTTLLNCASKDIIFDTKALGATVKLLRERLSLTQTQLGDSASLSAAEISKLENGSRKKIPIDTLIKICPHLNVPLDYLLVSCIPDCQNDYEHFYNFEGNEIDLYNIARNLYSVDSELLILLSDSHFLSDLEFIKFIKLWLKAKNKLKNSINQKNGNPFHKMFEKLQKYCYDFLQLIIDSLL